MRLLQIIVLAIIVCTLSFGPFPSASTGQIKCRPQSSDEIGFADPRGFVLSSRYYSIRERQREFIVFEYRICNSSSQTATVNWSSANLRLPFVESSGRDETTIVKMDKWLFSNPTRANSGATIETRLGTFTLDNAPAYLPFGEQIIMSIKHILGSLPIGEIVSIITSLTRSPEPEIIAESSVQKTSSEKFVYSYGTTKSINASLFAAWLSTASKQRQSGEDIALLMSEFKSSRNLQGGTPIVVNDLLLLTQGSRENLPMAAENPVIGKSWAAAGKIEPRFLELQKVLEKFRQTTAVLAPAFVPEQLRGP